MTPALSSAVLDALPANVAVLDKDGAIVAVNSAWKRFAAQNNGSASPGVGVNYLEVARNATGPFSEEAKAAYHGIQAVLAGSTPRFSMEYPCHSPNCRRWFQLEVTSLPQAGRPAAVVMHHDITRRKLAEEAVQVSERRFRTLTENSPDGLLLLSGDGTILPGTSAGTLVTGYGVDENAGQSIFEFVHPEDVARLVMVLAERPSKERIVCRYLHKNGSWRWLEAVAVNLLDDPVVQAIVVNYRDITERKHAEELHQASEERFRLLLEGVKDYAIFMLDPDGYVKTWNSGAERISGFTVEEIIGKNLAFFYPPEDVLKGKPQQELNDARTYGRSVHQGWRISKDGMRFWAECVTTALRDDKGNLRGFSRVTRDITDAKRSEESLRSIVDHSIDAIVTIDHQGMIQSCAGAFQKLFGYLPADVVGKNVKVLMPDPWHSEHDNYLTNYLHTGVAKVIGKSREVVGRRKDGAAVALELTITEFALDGSRFFTAIMRDISERKKLEEQLRQSQKLEAIGQLAGGVAHDFNNLITIINGYCELLLSSLPANNPARNFLDEIFHAGNRAAGLTSQLLAFSRKQILEPKVINLNDVIEGTQRMLRRMIREDISLISHYDPTLSRVKVDPSQIEQVILNLAINALDAMPKGGTLTISTRNVTIDPEHSQPHSGVKPGRYVALAMSDTGHGMKPEIQARIFEPFFTTKEIGKGTGLGLATVFGIVKQSEGHINVSSTEGIGTTFEVLLPAVAVGAVDAPISREDLPRRGSETILLVEDEEGVRQVARHILEMNGYTVLQAHGGKEAIELANANAGPIHLLITDVVMPEMSGRHLAESLRNQKQHASMKVLYMSGYTDDSVILAGITEARKDLLQKPFSLPSLARKVREILDRTN